MASIALLHSRRASLMISGSITVFLCFVLIGCAKFSPFWETTLHPSEWLHPRWRREVRFQRLWGRRRKLEWDPGCGAGAIDSGDARHLGFTDVYGPFMDVCGGIWLLDVSGFQLTRIDFRFKGTLCWELRIELTSMRFWSNHHTHTHIFLSL